MFPFNGELKLSEATYSDAAYAGMQRLHELRMSDTSMAHYLNSSMTYAYGTGFSKNFPTLTELQGKNKKRAVKSIDGTVYMYLLGKPKKTSVVGKCVYSPNDAIGANNSTIFIYFKDRWFMKNQKIYGGGFNGTQLHLQSSGEKEGSYYKYTAKVIGGGTVPYALMQPGTVWGAGVVAVSLEHSHGTESRSYGGYRIQNQIGMYRASINVAGNISNKVMNVSIVTDKGTFTTYTDWERHLAELTFNEAKEIDLIMSKWNKDEDGYIQNVDVDSNKPVPMGMGIWEQIPNFNTLYYSRLTENKLSRWITDILSIAGNLDMIGKSGYYIDIIGGYGLMEEFNNAIMRNSSKLTFIDSNYFIKDNGTRGGLQYGAYFTEYRHLSGVIFRFTHHPFFDANSPLADSSPVHPLNPSLRLSSYFGMVLNFGEVSVGKDMSKSGTAHNIEYLFEEGREYDEWVVEGGSKLPNVNKSYSRSTDIDASAQHMVCTQGVHCHYPSSMGKIICRM